MMARIIIVPKHSPMDEVHAITYDPKATLDTPPMVDFGAYLYNLSKGTKTEIRWPYEWVRYTAARNRLDYILVREYDNGKTEFRAMRNDGELLLLWYDNPAVALRRAYARFIPRHVTRHVIVKGQSRS
jgi:hypothetical protein